MRTEGKRRRGYGRVAAAVLAAVLLAGCQSKYQPIETGAARTEETAAVLQAEDAAAGRQQNSPIQAENMNRVSGAVGPGETAAGAGDPGETASGGVGLGEAGPGAAETAAQTAGPGETAAQTSAQEPETAGVFQDADETVYVTGDNVNVRAADSTQSEVITTLNRGAALKRTGYSEEWSRVIWQERECYVSSQFLTAKEPETAASVPAAASEIAAEGEVRLNPSWPYAEYSKINSGAAVLYRSSSANRKGITVCVNAGHGTKGGGSVSTLCHPDGSPKVTGGSTAAGATTATAVSSGMTFADGTAEAKVTLALALKLKERLLDAGYDVLMIRETDDVQLDNIARTVIANNAASCHIALHWDSTSSDKGAFYMSVPGNSSYRAMEPVKSNWQKHNSLGESLISGLKGAGVKIFSGGSMEMDLTQTSYSTVPSVDIELGDKVSDHSDSALETLAGGLLAGINAFFGQ